MLVNTYYGSARFILTSSEYNLQLPTIIIRTKLA